MRLQHAAMVAIAAAAVTVVAACSGSSSAPETTSSSSTTSTVSTTTSSSTTSSSSTTTSTPTPTPTTTSTSAAKPKPTDPLTGKAVSKNPVLAVKIDNTVFPQYGITAADIIYAEQVEGGLTRLIAVFHSKLPEEVGPVRSIRSTDMQLLPSFGEPLLVGSGGAPAQLKRLRNSGLPSALFDAGAAGMWRSNAARAPYNVHANLKTIAKAHPKAGKAQPMGFRFAAKDSRLAKARKATTIDVTMLAGRFTFDYAKGSYYPHHSGTQYVDEKGKKVAVQNVLVQHVKDEPDGTLDPIGNPSYLSHTVGKGSFTLYRNGKAIDGTWTRKDVSDPTTFVDGNGKTVTFQPGRTWVLLAPQTSSFNKG